MQEKSNPNDEIAARFSVSAVAHCIVESQSGQITAIDAQLANWLGLKPKHCNGSQVSGFAPELSGIKWSTVPREGISLQAHLVNKERTQRRVEIAITPLIGPQEDCVLVTLRSAEAASGIINRDALTGLPDRRELARQHEHWKRNRPEGSMPHAVLFMDLDEFKKVNDAHGHAVGDKVLEVLAPRWQKCIRADDLIVRYGGDEFVVLLAGIQEQRDVKPVIDRLVAATAEPINVGKLQLHVAVSIGVALTEDVPIDLEQLIEQADRDMYAKKFDDSN